jgi:hypothetical protein
MWLTAIGCGNSLSQFPEAVTRDRLKGAIRDKLLQVCQRVASHHMRPCVDRRSDFRRSQFTWPRDLGLQLCEASLTISFCCSA